MALLARAEKFHNRQRLRIGAERYGRSRCNYREQVQDSEQRLDIRGHYGSFCQFALYHIFIHLDRYLARWAMRKFKCLKWQKCRVRLWLKDCANRQPDLLVHWCLLYPAAGR